MNSAISSISPSATLAIAAAAKQLVAEGKRVCDFSVGEPDFDTPQSIKDAAARALADGKTKYTPARGLPALCSAISGKLKAENNLEYAPSQIIVSGGAKMSLATAFAALLNPGDEALIPAPYWLSYPEMVRLAGGVPVFVKGADETGFKITPAQLEAAITPRTVVFVLNSPSNPTGLVYSRDEIAALAEVCLRHKLWIVADEIYERMVYAGETHTSVAAFSKEHYERTITINGFSKAYAMTGWRLGYAAGPASVISAMETVQSHLASAPATFAQFGAIAAFKAEAEIQPMLAAFAQRNELVYNLVSQIKGVVCKRPKGAFYVFPNIASFGLSSTEFANRLIKEKHVAAVPGVAFGADENIRFSYACSNDEIIEGMKRLKEFCESL
ncbi:MAG: pyridoxal phosphate-dependent aminotransferase [Kiritimatiellaeota bacterium]|nr:pyridoxal phosphate-dependent aminotransferase [Kiritimatiellota bacterium]